MIQKLKSLKNHQGFMKYFKNTSWLFGEKILRMIVGLFVGIWVARYLGPEQFGLFSYAQSFVGLFTAIATLGLDGIVVRELVKSPKLINKLIGTSFFLKLFGAILTLIILVIAIGFTSNDSYANSLILIIASATIFQSFNVVDFYFQAKVFSKYIVFTNIFSLLISSIVKIYLILNEAELEAFAWVILFDSCILACGFIYFYLKQNLSIGKWSFDKELAKSLLSDSWPLILSSMVIAIYLRIDQVMIKEIIDSEAVGQYAAALRLSESWYFIPMIISASLFPAIIQAKKISLQLYYSRLQKIFDLMFWIAIFIAIPITFFSEDIIDLLYGDKYDMASEVLIIHIWTGLIIFLGVPRSKWFISENLVKYSFYTSLFGVFINIILNYFLIPAYGIYGAAYATLISSLLGTYLFNLVNSKLLIIFKLQTNAILLPLRQLGISFKIKLETREK